MTVKPVERRIWPVLVASGLGLAILLALGVWQVERLAWKEQLIAEIDAAIAAPPVPLAEVLNRHGAGQRIDGMKITAEGSFLATPPFRLLASAGGQPAWELVQPFATPDGTTFLVNRGKIGDAQPQPPAPTGEVAITGHVQIHNLGRGFFDVDNQPAKNQWYWWDVASMQQEAKATGGIPGLVINLLPGSPGTEGLEVEPPKANLRNNHLGYAITWFGLAAVLLVMTGVFLRSARRP